MGTLNWSDLLDGAVYALDLYDPVANPDGVVLHIDDPGIHAYDLYIIVNDDLNVATITDFYTQKTVTFNVDILTVTTDNVTLADGSLILVGDNSYGTANDHAGNTLIGSGRHDALLGLGGNDSLVGGTGRDVFLDPFGNNTLVGGSGNDWFIVYSEVGSANTVTGGAGQDVYHVDDGSPSLLAGFQSHNYRVTDFTPGAGGDIIFVSEFLYSLAIGYVDQDPFAAGFLRFRQSGANTLLQGDRDGAAGSTYTWATLITLKNVSATSLTPDNFLDLVVGTGANDLLTGTDRDQRNEGDDVIPGLLGNDTLEGLSGSDYLTAAAGNDVLDGGLGADFMLGGTGRDLYYVDHADDQVVEVSNGAAAMSEQPAAVDNFTDTVEAVVNYSLSNVEYVENLRLEGNATSGTGNGLNNKVTGNARHNTLNGLGGNDTLEGGEGRDTMKGGAGNDTLSGGTENDTLIGMGGGDLLRGSAGNDTLTGSAGQDDFEFNAALSSATNLDRITDFSRASDTIWLDNAVFTAFATAGVAMAGTAFHGGPGVTAAHDGNDRILYNSNSGKLYYDADGSAASSSPIHFATLTGAPVITAADFFII